MHGRKDVLLLMLLCLIGFKPVHAHDGPDPVAHWEFTRGQTEHSVLKARLGPDATIVGSSQGDLRARELSRLYDEFQVDIVWNGHIHSYERTWPVRKGKAVERNGTIYMITGGAGGGLETAGPFRPYFQNNVKHGHHYCMVMVNGGTLELKAFDLDGRLFDTTTLRKEKSNPPEQRYTPSESE